MPWYRTGRGSRRTLGGLREGGSAQLNRLDSDNGLPLGIPRVRVMNKSTSKRESQLSLPLPSCYTWCDADCQSSAYSSNTIEATHALQPLVPLAPRLDFNPRLLLNFLTINKPLQTATRLTDRTGSQPSRRRLLVQSRRGMLALSSRRSQSSPHCQKRKSLLTRLTASSATRTCARSTAIGDPSSAYRGMLPTVATRALRHPYPTRSTTQQTSTPTSTRTRTPIPPRATRTIKTNRNPTPPVMNPLVEPAGSQAEADDLARQDTETFRNAGAGGSKGDDDEKEGGGGSKAGLSKADQELQDELQAERRRRQRRARARARGLVESSRRRRQGPISTWEACPKVLHSEHHDYFEFIVR